MPESAEKKTATSEVEEVKIKIMQTTTREGGEAAAATETGIEDAEVTLTLAQDPQAQTTSEEREAAVPDTRAEGTTNAVNAILEIAAIGVTPVIPEMLETLAILEAERTEMLVIAAIAAETEMVGKAERTREIRKNKGHLAMPIIDSCG